MKLNDVEKEAIKELIETEINELKNSIKIYEEEEFECLANEARESVKQLRDILNKIKDV